MGKNKLQRFKENLSFPHLFQPTFQESIQGDFHLKGKWHSDYFKNSNPIILELGCGRGEYTIRLAEQFPQKNHIGIDIKGARLWYGAKTAHQQDMPNVAFVRTRIETILSLFAPGEISEIWITFPDPQLKTRRTKKRLTAPGFLALYHKFLQSNATIHLKTDCQELHEYTLQVAHGVNATVRIALTDVDPHIHAIPELKIYTKYEQFFREQGKPITYLAIQLPHILPQFAIDEIPSPPVK